MEERLKSEDLERRERNERIVESLRQKHKSIVEQKEDELSDLKIKMSDIKDLSEKTRMERDSLRTEIDKLYD